MFTLHCILWVISGQFQFWEGMTSCFRVDTNVIAIVSFNGWVSQKLLIKMAIAWEKGILNSKLHSTMKVKLAK